MKYEEAKEKALKINEKVNSCLEFNAAYVFFDENNGAVLDGPDAPVVVMKSDGKITTVMEFMETKKFGDKGHRRPFWLESIE